MAVPLPNLTLSSNPIATAQAGAGTDYLTFNNGISSGVSTMQIALIGGIALVGVVAAVYFLR